MGKFCVVVFCLLIGAGALSTSASAQDASRGKFVGTLVMEDPDPVGARNFRLREDLEYVDPRGVRWFARAGLDFDGATIPMPLWSLVGSPYTGRYRRAAVIHDYYCEHLYRPWEGVHRMFYDAMITDGVEPTKAKLMYYAVFRFGPRWDIKEIITCPPLMNCQNPGNLEVSVSTPRIKEADLPLYAQEISMATKLIESQNIGLDQIERLALGAPKRLAWDVQASKITDNWFDKAQRGPLPGNPPVRIENVP